ncbi:fibroin heavy chain-like [Nilaparvata lugens]|uniref:fibroin heavy chain-like n=1 Tax=Nilaparvata lugens TaxID=108931 RepID=UPI00193E251C|nr:fibroin heavy chain-like [Nilaparvata lugens]
MKTLVVVTALLCCVAAQYQHSFHVESVGGPSYEVSNSKTGFQIQSSGASSQFASSGAASRSSSSFSSSADAAAKSAIASQHASAAFAPAVYPSSSYSSSAGVSQYASADAAYKSAGVSQYASVAPVALAPAVFPAPAPVVYSNYQSFAPQKSSASFRSGSASSFGASSGSAVSDSVPVIVPQAPVVVPHPAPVAYAVPAFAAQSDAYQNSGVNSASYGSSQASQSFGSSQAAQAATRSGYSTFNTKPVSSTQYISGYSAPSVSQSFKSAVSKSGSNSGGSSTSYSSGIQAFGAKNSAAIKSSGFNAQSVAAQKVQSDSAAYNGASSSNAGANHFGAHFVQPAQFVAVQQPFVVQSDAAAYNAANSGSVAYNAANSGSAYVAGSDAYGYSAQPVQVAVQKSAINYGVVPASVHVARGGSVFGAAGGYRGDVKYAGQAKAFGAQAQQSHAASAASQSSSAAFDTKQVAAQQNAAQTSAFVAHSQSAVPTFRAQYGFGGAVSNFGSIASKYDAKSAYGLKDGFSAKKAATFVQPAQFGAKIHQGVGSQSGVVSTDSAHVVEAQSDVASASGYGVHSGSAAGASKNAFGYGVHSAYGAGASKDASAFGYGAYGSRGHNAGAFYASQTASGASRQAYPIAANAAFNAAAVQSYILRQNQDQSDDGFAYSYDTENGISVQSDGQVRNAGTDAASLAVTGSYSYTGDDGKVYTIQYVADERGFVPVGEHISQLSSEIARSIEYNFAHPEEWNVQQ